MCDLRREMKKMKKVIDLILKKIASIAEGAAVISIGTASCSGMYEPERPEGLKK